MGGKLLKHCRSTGAFVAMLLLFLAPTVVSAQSTSIAQSFETDVSKVVQGALVSIMPGKPGSVELASADNAYQLVGVVGKDPLIQLGDDSGNVQVITSGATMVLVSDISGDIKTGDKITASPVLGVGAKASTNTNIIATAQADLATAEATERTITDVDGNPHTIKIGLIPAQINATYYTETGERSFVPTFLQEFANAAAGKRVGTLQIIVSTLVLVLAFVSIAVLLYAAVKSSIISIGRNPLSEVSVRKGLLQAGLAALAILLGSLGIIMVVLRA